jgi:hypothetical protein
VRRASLFQKGDGTGHSVPTLFEACNKKPALRRVQRKPLPRSTTVGVISLSAVMGDSMPKANIITLAFVRQANDLQQSWRFEWEPPKAVLRDHWTIDWILGG